MGIKMDNGEAVVKWIKAQKLGGANDNDIKQELIIASRLFPEHASEYVDLRINAADAYQAIQRMRQYGTFVHSADKKEIKDFVLQ